METAGWSRSKVQLKHEEACRRPASGTKSVTINHSPFAPASVSVRHTFKKRMSWTFPWVSSVNSDFNQDYQVTFTPEEIDSGRAYYNYNNQGFPSTEAPVRAFISLYVEDRPGHF